MKCKCPPTSPFLWRQQPCQLDWGLMDRARQSSESTTKVVDRNRANGIEIGHRMPGGTTRVLDPKRFHIYGKA